MQLKLLTVTKRQNSTFQPSFNSDGLLLTDIKYRHPTSMHKPAYIVRPPASQIQYLTPAAIAQYNYAILYDETGASSGFALQQYAWVDDITVNVDGTWTVSTHVDVLAEHKSEILNADMFVLRNASTYNSKLGDTAVPTTLDDTSTTVNVSENIFAYNYNDGAFVVGLLNDDPSAVGVPHYYVMSMTEWTTFTTNLLNTVEWLQISSTEISENLQKALINPMQYITSARWFPCPVAFNSTLSEIPLGFWTIPNSPAKRWSGAFTTKTFSLTLPQHPQASSLAYLNYSPYANYRLTLEPFGEIELPSWVEGGNQIDGLIYVDPSTGEGTMRLTVGSAVIGTFYAKVGVDMQIGQIATDFSSLSVSDVVQAGASALSTPVENFFSIGAVEQIATGVISGLGSKATAVQSVGTHGSIAAYIDVPRVTGVFKHVSTTSYASLMGRPLCRVVELGTLTGYTLCAYGDIETSASPEERSEIARYLTTGFYIE